ncbi:MAG: YlxM family DNA-binding protein [Eubacteriales bacterium]|nr:YlxM family DNA-binding protein [Eubacteriales bacterium]
MEKNVTMALLMDFYGELLTPRQRDALHMHYEEDMSLAEIAQGLDITRQGVHDALKRGETALGTYEARLGLVSRYQKVQRAIQQARDSIAPHGGMTQAQCRVLLEKLDDIADIWEGANGL